MRKVEISKLFPVPIFLDPPIMGLDLSNESLKIIEIVEKRNKLSVGKFGDVSLPVGCIEAGEIKEPKSLKKVLVETKKKYNLKNIAVSLPEEKSYILDLNLPYVEPKAMRDSIELQLEEHVPFPVNKIVFDYDVISYNSESDEIHVNVSVLPKKIIHDHLKILEESGLEPVIFEAEAAALARAIIPRGDRGVFMVVDFGHTRTSISVVEDTHVVFSSIFELGGRDITKVIMKELDIDSEEAEKIKLERGITTDVEGRNLLSAAFPPLAVLKDEINKYQNYWNDKFDNENDKKQIEKIYFCGGSSALMGLTEFLAGYIDVPFELANPWVNVLSVEENIPPVHHNEALKYATTIGLALRNILKYE